MAKSLTPCQTVLGRELYVDLPMSRFQMRRMTLASRRLSNWRPSCGPGRLPFVVVPRSGLRESSLCFQGERKATETPKLRSGFRDRRREGRSVEGTASLPSRLFSACALGSESEVSHIVAEDSRPDALRDGKHPSVDHNSSSGLGRSLRLAWDVLKPDSPLLAVIFVTLVGSIIATLCFPLSLGDLFDVVRIQVSNSGAQAVAGSANHQGLVQTIADIRHAATVAPPSFRGVLLRLSSCLVISAIGNGILAYMAPLLGQRFGTRLRKRLMREVMARDQSFFDAVSKGETLSRLTQDIGVLQTNVSDFLAQRGIRSMLEVVISLGIIASKNPMLALVSFIITPMLSSMLRRVVSRAAELSYERQQSASRALEFANERLTNVRTVQLFAQEEQEGIEYEGLANQGYKLARRCAYFQGVVEGAGRLAVNVGTLMLLGLGGLLVISGRISLGSLLAFNVYNLFISVGLSSMAASLGDLGKAVGALQRITEIVENDGKDPASKCLETLTIDLGNEQALDFVNESEPRPTGAKAPTTSSHHPVSRQQGVSVEFKDVWFRYPTQQDWALKGLNFSIAPGKTLALVGASGSGKTTVAALLLGLYQPQRGSIKIDRVTLTKDNIPHFRKFFSAVLQKPSLFSGPIADNIRLGAPEATDKDVRRAAMLAYADDFVSELPQSYDTILEERGQSLSGGQQQRMSIARALVCRPRGLLLDEPTSALDAEAERAIQTTLRELQGCTKILIAHRLSTVRRADVIVVLSHGEVVESGRHEELMSRGGAYARMVAEAGEEGCFDSDDVDKSGAIERLSRDGMDDMSETIVESVGYEDEAHDVRVSANGPLYVAETSMPGPTRTVDA